MPKFWFTFLLVALAGALPGLVNADGLWQADGRLVSDAYVDQFFLRTTPDGAGGALLAWADRRDSATTGRDIYVQRINASGNRLWGGSTSLLVNNNANDQLSVRICSDGAGGAIIAWVDNGTDPYGPGATQNIYAQRITSAGVADWSPSTGVAVCVTSGRQYSPQIIADGAGGAIIVWTDERDDITTGSDIYAARVANNGTFPWTANGEVVTNYTSDQDSPALTADGANGAIVVWTDRRVANSDIYGQRVNASGSRVWTAALDGVVLGSAVSLQMEPKVVSNGSGGAIVVWHDYRSGSYYDLFGEGVDALGNTTSGLLGGIAIREVPASTDNQPLYFEMVSDGVSGAFVAWRDYRNPANNYDVYCQYINASISSQWTTNGVLACDEITRQNWPVLCPDGSGGVFVAWDDWRNGGSTNRDIYAQRINASGAIQWLPDGIPVCAESTTSQYPVVFNNGSQTAFFLWEDSRSPQFLPTLRDIYAQNLIRPFPRIYTLTPDQTPQGSTLDDALITGDFFQDDRGSVTYVKLTLTGQPDIIATDLNVSDAQNLTCDFTLLSTTAIGVWNVVAYDSLGQTSTPGAAILTVFPPQVTGLTWISIPAANFVPNSQDNLVAQINCAVDGYDVLQTLTVQNIGTAQSATDLTGLDLWLLAGGSSGGITFDPALAQRIGSFTALSADTWQITLSQNVSNLDALYLTANISGSARVGNTCQFALPAGNAGFAYGTSLPSSTLFNTAIQTIAASLSVVLDLDTLAPVNVVHAQPSIVLGSISLTNQGGTAVSLQSLIIGLQDAANQAQPLSSVFSALRLRQGGALLTEATPPPANGLFTLSSPVTVDSTSEIQLTLEGDIATAPITSAFKIGFLDENCLNGGALIPLPVQGKTFPLLTTIVHVREPSLGAAFRVYPNPFTPGPGQLNIHYFAPEPAHVKLELFTTQGGSVRVLVDADRVAGAYETSWDGKNQDGRNVLSGVYLLRIVQRAHNGGQETALRKIAVVR